jgi:hypothetical protein
MKTTEPGKSRITTLKQETAVCATPRLNFYTTMAEKRTAAASDLEREDWTFSNVEITENNSADPLAPTLDSPSSESWMGDRRLREPDFIAKLSERQVLQLSPEEDELLDPIERAIRYVVPIPKHYYWELAKTEDEWAAVPVTIKVWHTTIASCATVGTWTNDYIAQPIASFFGLTGPRFFEVISYMNEEELAESVRSARARIREDTELRERNVTPTA